MMYNATIRILRGGDPAPASAGETTANQMQALITHLPDLTRVTGENILPFEQARLDASKAISPQENALALQLYQQFGPALNALGMQIAGQNQQAAVSNDAAALNAASNAGLVDKALALQRQADPEYYKMREGIGAGASRLMQSFEGDGGMLSPTELEQIARGLNRTNVRAGLNSVGSPTAGVVNAMQFGEAGQQRKMNFQNSLSSALASTANAMAGTKSGFDPFQVATGRSAFAPNTGENKFQGNSQGLGQSTLGLSNNLLQQTGENARQYNQLNAQRRDSLDRFNTTFDGVMSGVGSLGRGFYKVCWVAREVYGQDNPKWVMFYHWLHTFAPDWFRDLYIKRGEKFARFISNKPRLKAVIRWWMDSKI